MLVTHSLSSFLKNINSLNFSLKERLMHSESVFRAGQYLNTMYLNTVYKYI